jgi:hypothetical protein
VKNSLLDISTPEKEAMMLSRNIGHQSPSDALPELHTTETSVAQLQKSENWHAERLSYSKNGSDSRSCDVATAVI